MIVHVSCTVTLSEDTIVGHLYSVKKDKINVTGFTYTHIQFATLFDKLLSL